MKKTIELTNKQTVKITKQRTLALVSFDGQKQIPFKKLNLAKKAA